MTALLPSTTPASSEIFDLWAQVYDDQPNPMIALEERLLTPLLPSVTDADVLDAGCGTGRWLRRLEHHAPRSLTGCDCSTAMLDRARNKLAPTTALHLCRSSSIPCSDASLDLVLASFVLSYLDNLDAFAAECARILRPGGHILISDLHPVTAADRGWKRSFKLDGADLALPAHTHPLREIVSTFGRHGLDLIQLEEPSFGAAERPIFARCHRLAEFADLTAVPAIYLLKLQKRTTTLRLTGAPWSAGPHRWNAATTLTMRTGRIATEDLVTPSAAIDLDGYVLLPGLINAHDHLEFALFPNLGRAPEAAPYGNASEWATEIHQTHGATIARNLQVPLETRLWWGAIRNLLCGVTTVCHHNPIHPCLSTPDFPVRVLSDFAWSHSLAFDPNVVEAYRATPTDQPFILHAAEGTDSQSREEFAQLDRLQLLDHRTVLVHGLALNLEDIALLNTRASSLILCPTSNRFLFHQTLAPTLIAATHRIALGSDSPLTAAGDLLDEIAFLHAHTDLDAGALYGLVTSNPAALLKLTEGQGQIAPGASTDLIAVRDRQLSPANTLASLTVADVELVVLRGQVQLTSETLYDRLPHEQRIGLQLLEVDGHRRWLRAPLSVLFASAQQVLGPGTLRLGNKEVRCSSIK